MPAAPGAALDDRIACADTALRPLSTREIVKHLEPFGISEHMTCHRMIETFSAGQKSRQDASRYIKKQGMNTSLCITFLAHG